MMNIIWFDYLYVGEKARKKRYRIMQGIRRSKPKANIYVIIPALHGNNIFDIYSTRELFGPYFKREDIFILGIAADYWEALEVAGKMIHEMYHMTGGFNLPVFLEKKISKV